MLRVLVGTPWGGTERHLRGTVVARPPIQRCGLKGLLPLIFQASCLVVPGVLPGTPEVLGLALREEAVAWSWSSSCWGGGGPAAPGVG